MSEDANWAQKSMSFVFSCQHISKRLCPVLERGTLKEASLFGSYYYYSFLLELGELIAILKKKVTAVRFSNMRANIDIFLKKIDKGMPNWHTLKRKGCIKASRVRRYLFCHYIPLCLFHHKGGFSHSFCLSPDVESRFLGCFLNDLCN